MIMKFKDRSGKVITKKDTQQKLLNLLYGSTVSRIALKPLTSRTFSDIAGKFCSSRTSQFMILPFIKSAGIDMSEYQPAAYCSYNDFFTRKIKPERRPIDMTPSHLISPCDSKLSVYKIDQNSVYCIKNSFYSVSSLLRCRSLAEKYHGGWCMIFRLEVDDYHRYSYIDNGTKSVNKRINGHYHTVNPAALEHFNVYKENTREITLMHTQNFEDVVQIEVGAMMVGRITNLHGAAQIKRGQEKGYFEFGGSTIILLFKENTVVPDEDILKNTADGFETIVKLGEKIGYADITL